MATETHLGIIAAAASGANATLNLANVAIGTLATGLGVIAANVNGPIGVPPTTGVTRGLVITIDNRLGTADAYLSRPEDIPTAGTETATIGALVVVAGSVIEFGDLDAKSWQYILRLLDGASVKVTVAHTGPTWA
jgi:hypothetical protein